MLRWALFASAIAGLTMLAAGVLDAAPVIFWGTRNELASIEHGRATMLAGAALTVAAAAAFAALRERRAAALLAAAALLPAACVLSAPRTSLGVLVLVPALPAGVGGAIVGCSRPDDRARVVVSGLLGIITLAAAVANGVGWGAVVGTALALVAYLHARAGGAPPRAAIAALVPGARLAALAAIAVLAGSALAA